MTYNTDVQNISQISNPKASRQALYGVFWKVFSCACFAGINAIVRYLSGGASIEIEHPLPTHVLMFFQNIFGSVFLILFLLHSSTRFSFSTRYLNLHVLRVITAVLGIALWYLTLQNMPIAMGVALSFTGPIFTILGARLFLKEYVTPQRGVAIFLSLVGAFIISRPDLAFLGKTSDSLGWLVLLPLSSAIALSFNKLLTRKLTTFGEKPETLATYLLVLMAPVSLVLAIPEWVTPLISQLPWLMALGLLSAGAHLSFGKAYSKAEVTYLTPFGFSKFLFSSCLGYLCFLEIPSFKVWLGTLVIGFAIFLLYYKMPLYSLAKRFKSN